MIAKIITHSHKILYLWMLCGEIKVFIITCYYRMQTLIKTLQVCIKRLVQYVLVNQL